MELEVTWNRAIRVWWSYLWRNLIAIIISMVMGGIIGGIIGAVMGAFDFPMETIKIVTMPIGFILGLIISVFPMKMIIGRNFGEFRLVLIKNE